jgi:predicted cupin superfamily sugar epimerase
LRLDLTVSGEGRRAAALGPDLGRGERPQIVVPAHAWQSATPVGGWALVSCVVAPAFDFAGFELAPEGFEPD